MENKSRIPILINITLDKLGAINRPPPIMYYKHPYKDLLYSYRCYLNWVKYGQAPPRFHNCKCMEVCSFNSLS